ncbi:Tyrosine specific protein phosphatases domain-containing protein [Plasmodiophora brassicae]
MTDRGSKVTVSVLKNLDKWMRVENFGGIVEGTNLLPMKTFSRDDSHGHTLRAFLDAKPRVRVIVDLSSDLDNYDVDGRIVRHKVPLVAKSVPSAADVSRFIDLVQASNRMSHEEGPVQIGVHCHYGFNRTGFLICAYLIEVHRVTPAMAIERFERARPPGIRHASFRAALHVRYGHEYSGQ